LVYLLTLIKKRVINKMKTIIKISLSIIGITLMHACKNKFDDKKLSSGTANFTRYVAVGNSLCAGFTDGALSYEGQVNSFPRMLAAQFSLVGGGEFKTPFLSNIGNGNNGSGSPAYQLVLQADNSVLPKIIGTATNINDGSTIAAAGPYNHIGVPGIRAVDATVAGYGIFNPFLGRINNNSVTRSLITEALATNPTFFTFWLGSNDVLGWALEGGTGAVQTTVGFPFPGSLTYPGTLKISIEAALDSLIQNGAKGVVANVPDVSSTPYFTTIPYTYNITRQSLVDSLNTAYIAYNASAPSASKINWVLGANPLIINDDNAFFSLRKATANDYICLSAANAISSGQGLFTPLADNLVLDIDEANLARTYTSSYNTYIKNAADARNLAYFDVNSFLATFKNGLMYNGVNISPVFVTGGGFGLDGVHPTPRGYALIANEFIKVINKHYNACIPMVDVLKYRSVPLP
jgi:hypothetical protein